MKYLSRAIKEAKKSKHKFKHAALLIRGGAIISYAFNNGKNHAEIRAIKRAKNPKGAILISIRVTKPDSNMSLSSPLANARPCSVCEIACRKAGVAHVFYSSGNETSLGPILNRLWL